MEIAGACAIKVHLCHFPHLTEMGARGGELCSLSQGLGNHSKFGENAETLKLWFSTCGLRSYGEGQLTLSRELHIRYLYFIIYIS